MINNTECTVSQAQKTYNQKDRSYSWTPQSNVCIGLYYGKGITQLERRV